MTSVPQSSEVITPPLHQSLINDSQPSSVAASPSSDMQWLKVTEALQRQTQQDPGVSLDVCALQQLTDKSNITEETQT